MAVTRKSLKAMGLTDEQVDSIIEMHTDTVDGLKEEIKKYKGEAEKLPGVQKELDDLKAKGDDGWKEKHDTVKKEFDEYKAAQTKKETREAKEKAFREILKDAKVSEKRIDTILKVTDFDSIELGEDGKVKDADKHKETVQKEWADFIVKTKTNPADVDKPPLNNPISPKTREEIYKKDDKGRYLMDAAARQKALAESMNNTDE